MISPNTPSTVDTKTVSEPLKNFSLASRKTSRQEFAGGALLAALGLSIAGYGDHLLAEWPLQAPSWGAEALRTLKPSSGRLTEEVKAAAIKLGEAASERDKLQIEYKQHTPQYNKRVAGEHEAFKEKAVTVSKSLFPEELPNSVSYYTKESHFGPFIKHTVPRLFASKGVVVNLTNTAMDVPGAPDSLNYNIEVAEARAFTNQTMSIWGERISCSELILGDNFSKVDISRDDFSVNEVLGQFSGSTRRILLNAGGSKGSYDSQMQHAKNVSNTEPLEYFKLMLNYSADQKEASAAAMLFRSMAQEILGEGINKKLSLKNFMNETRAHEYAHGFRKEHHKFWRYDSPKGLSIAEESFAYAGEIGYADRLDNVIFDLIQANYLSKGYEPHIQAKRRVWDIMIWELRKNPGDFDVKVKDGKAFAAPHEAIEALQDLVNEPEKRLLLSTRIKDRLISDTSYRTVSPPQAVGAGFLAFSALPLYFARLNQKKSQCYKKLEDAIEALGSLGIDDEKMSSIHKMLLPAQQLDKNNLESVRIGLLLLGVYAGKEGINAGITLSKAYWGFLNQQSASTLTGWPVKSEREFISFMMAPALIHYLSDFQEHGDSLLYSKSTFESFEGLEQVKEYEELAAEVTRRVLAQHPDLFELAYGLEHLVKNHKAANTPKGKKKLPN